LTQTKNGDFELRTPYDRVLVSALKSQVPVSERRWDATQKIWLIHPSAASLVAGLVNQVLGTDIRVSTSAPVAVKPETKLVKIEYLGAAKDRGGAEPVAYGYADRDWSVAIPLSVLKEWFVPGMDTARPEDATTLYAVLGIGKGAAADEVKAAYRRLARQWHPDVCREPDAAQQFMRIKDAYDILSDDLKRRKYDVGLQLAAQSTENRDRRYVNQLADPTWRPPLRCGWVLVEGVTSLGRLNVSKILQWEDISDESGRIMVTSWPMGGDMFEVDWV
jgi:hypothetical protein